MDALAHPPISPIPPSSLPPLTTHPHRLASDRAPALVAPPARPRGNGNG